MKVVRNDYKEKEGGVIQELKSIKTAYKCKHTDRLLYARGMCRNCYEKWLRKNNPEYSERQRENSRKWRKKFADKKRASDRNWRAKKDPEYLKLSSRLGILNNYGLTMDDYNEMMKDQNNVCAICGKPPKKDKNLSIDHDHETGLIRGLLCFRCNFGLSYFGEDLDTIEKAFIYLLEAGSKNEILRGVKNEVG